MKKKFLTMLTIGLFILSVTGIANATTLTFDTPNTPGIIISGSMGWNNIGDEISPFNWYSGGHLYINNCFSDSSIIFDFNESTYVNDFQMNAMPIGICSVGDIGSIDIKALDASGNTVWSTTSDLTGYTDWNDWLTISVETNNVAQLYFTAPGNFPYFNKFWPSVDNLRIDENTNPVPEPATIMLFGAGLVSIAGSQLKKMKKRQQK